MLVLDAAAAARFDRVAFSPDSRRVAAGCWHGVSAWDLAAPDEPEVLTAEGVHCVAYLPDNTLCVGAYRDSRSSPTRCGRLLVSDFLAVSPTAAAVVRKDRDDRNPTTLLRCTVRAAGGVKELWAKPEPVQHTLTVTPDGRRIAIPHSAVVEGKEVNGIRFLDLVTGRTVEDVRLTENLPGLTISPDGGWFVSPFLNHVRCWHRGQKGGQVRRIENDSREHIVGVAFHPSGRYLAATSNDATVKLYDTATWALATTFTWDLGRMRGVAFSPDGALVAAGSDTGRVVVWDVDP